MQRNGSVGAGYSDRKPIDPVENIVRWSLLGKIFEISRPVHEQQKPHGGEHEECDRRVLGTLVHPWIHDGVRESLGTRADYREFT